MGVLPFFEVLDWDRASVRVWPYELDHITERLRGIPQQMVTEMKEQVCVCIYIYILRQFANQKLQASVTVLGTFPGTPPGCGISSTLKLMSTTKEKGLSRGFSHCVTQLVTKQHGESPHD